MSTSKRIDKICVAGIAVTLVLALLFLFGEPLGIAVASKVQKYEKTIFDTSYVHSIDIVMDDWDGFIEGCEDEEYAPCTVVVDGTNLGEVAIRAKGNTSLSNVSSLGSQRYSFKLEFDHYEGQKTLDGLDKLCLNNLIQDNTMMKDYIVYRMMDEFGADSPLCSFAYLTVNGEEWGLYLAVESVEDSFLQRNYGSETGDLYKPDSLSFGGGRGNGKDFNMDDLDFDFDDFYPTTQGGEMPDFGNMPQMPQGGDTGDFDFGDFDPTAQGGEMPDFGNMPQMPQGGDMGDFDFGDFDPTTQTGEMPQMPQGGEMPEMPESADSDQTTGNGGGFGGFGGGNMPQMNGGGGFGGMGSSDVKLQYIDDDPSSYSNIFNNAKTDVSSADEKRLIASLKNLSSYTDLENTVDVDEVLRYFVVHNFVCNGDSYTGSMIHNYYLYESDGQLSMIPWDYNLAFGTFQGGNASSTVNTSIDNPLSGGDLDDRPMLGWIFSDEAYTELYHELFADFIAEWFDSGKLVRMIEDTAEMIRPYVEKDPTKFCTTEEFDTGVSVMTQFVSLRAEAVNRQLSGDSTAVETGDLNLSDMGSMGSTMGGGNMGGGHGGDRGDEDSAESRTMPGGFSKDNTSGDTNSGNSSESTKRGGMQPPSEDRSGDSGGFSGKQSTSLGNTIWIWLGVSVLLLAVGILIAKKYHRSN